MLFDSSNFPGSGSFSWKWMRVDKETTPGKYSPPPAHPDQDETLVVGGYDLRPGSFQDYLLDLITLAGIRAAVGDLEDADGNPVANWLRAKGLKLLFDEELGRYVILQPGTPEQPGGVLCALPDYLARYLELLDDDTFTERLVPAYQALALLTYIVTTERYRALG